jgi:serine/threonine protein kinase
MYEAAALEPPFKASDMAELYRKVTAGHYPPIPNSFSQDLHAAIGAMLQVNPAFRPNCDKLLALPCISRNIVSGGTGSLES